MNMFDELFKKGKDENFMIQEVVTYKDLNP